MRHSLIHLHCSYFLILMVMLIRWNITWHCYETGGWCSRKVPKIFRSKFPFNSIFFLTMTYYMSLRSQPQIDSVTTVAYSWAFREILYFAQNVQYLKQMRGCYQTSNCGTLLRNWSLHYEIFTNAGDVIWCPSDFDWSISVNNLHNQKVWIGFK